MVVILRCDIKKTNQTQTLCLNKFAVVMPFLRHFENVEVCQINIYPLLLKFYRNQLLYIICHEFE